MPGAWQPAELQIGNMNPTGRGLSRRPAHHSSFRKGWIIMVCSRCSFILFYEHVAETLDVFRTEAPFQEVRLRAAVALVQMA